MKIDDKAILNSLEMNPRGILFTEEQEISI